MSVDRLKSGIRGLDELVEGGFPKGSAILVSGGPGAGKTNFCLQYLWYGAMHNEPGVYITFEEDPADLEIVGSRFGWNLSKLQQEKKLVIERFRDINNINNFLDQVKKIVKKTKAQRLVIDSLSSLTICATTFQSILDDLPVGARVEKNLPLTPSESAIVRRTMYKAIDFLKDMNLTVLLPSESEESKFSRHGVEEFVVDGLISLHYSSIGAKLFGNLEVRKMRKTKHVHGIFDYIMSDKGIEVMSKKKLSTVMK